MERNSRDDKSPSDLELVLSRGGPAIGRARTTLPFLIQTSDPYVLVVERLNLSANTTTTEELAASMTLPTPEVAHAIDDLKRDHMVLEPSTGVWALSAEGKHFAARIALARTVLKQSNSR
jgi:hypothetical protein